MAVLSQATLARLNYTTDPLLLQVARTATPGWLLAIGIATIGTTKLSNCSAVFRPALVMLREVSYSSFSWGPDRLHWKHRAERQSSALSATLQIRSGQDCSALIGSPCSRHLHLDVRPVTMEDDSTSKT